MGQYPVEGSARATRPASQYFHLMSPSPLSETLAKLRTRYAAAAPATIAIFQRSTEALAADPGSVTVLAALRQDLHRVHGTAGSYGFHEASRLAGEFESRVLTWEKDPALELAERAAVVARFVALLELALRASEAR